MVGKKEGTWKKWEKPGDYHFINRIQWDQQELQSIMEPFNEDWHGYGSSHQKFEKKLSEFSGINYFNLTNSGSTAILTALKVLKHQGRFNYGDLILHPITTFPTSISSAIDLGGVPVFVDTRPGTYVIDEDQVQKAIEKYPQIRGMIVPHLLGNMPDMYKIKNSLGDRFLIEDCCDTLGSYFDEQHAGSFGDFVAFSFYGSHHITSAGVGGAVATNDEELSKLAKSIIFWGRDKYVNTKDQKNDFLQRYDCNTIGSDFQMSAIQAAFGLSQIGKLTKFIQLRSKQFQEMNEIFRKDEIGFELPKEHSLAEICWFSYPLLVKGDAPFSRDDFVKYLQEKNVETRPIMVANLLKQIPYSNIKRRTLDDEIFPVADNIEKNGLFIPAWGMPKDQKQDYYGILEGFVKKINKFKRRKVRVSVV